jgi:hypothetical protein
MSVLKAVLDDMNTHQILPGLVDGQQLLCIEGTFLPAPLHARYPGNHLLVNCLYNPGIACLSPEMIIRLARKDTIAILRALNTEGLPGQAQSICVTFICKNKNRESIIRLYRFNILSEKLPCIDQDINENLFVSCDTCIQCSDVDDITAWLESEKSGRGHI